MPDRMKAGVTSPGVPGSVMARAGKVLAMLVAAVPFAFGAIRLVTTGQDARYVWMAVASSLGALVALALPLRGAALTIQRTGASVLASAASAATVALLLGGRAGPGVAVVALGFGLCSSAGFVWLARLRGGARDPNAR